MARARHRQARGTQLFIVSVSRQQLKATSMSSPQRSHRTYRQPVVQPATGQVRLELAPHEGGQSTHLIVLLDASDELGQGLLDDPVEHRVLRSPPRVRPRRVTRHRHPHTQARVRLTGRAA